MNAAGQRRLTPVLAGGALLLGALWGSLLFGVGRGVRWAPPRAVPVQVAAGAPAALPAPVPAEAFAPVWQQSLFSPDRKPEAHAVSGGSNLGDLQLTGIILTPQLRMALLRDAVSKKELRVREGESLPDGSASVVEVRSRSVILDSPQGRTELKLPAGAPITASAAPDAGPSPPPAPSPRSHPMSSERLQKLRAAVLQRRAAGQAGNPEGAH